MLQIREICRLKAFMIQCIKLGQANPFENPEFIAETIIHDLKRKIIRRVK